MRPFPLTPDEDAVRIANRMIVSQNDGWLECTICEGKRFWDLESARDHINGDRHKRLLYNVEWEEFTSNPDNGTLGNPDLGIPPEIECRGDTWFKCLVCNLGGEFWDPKQVLVHVNGKGHRAKMLKRESEEPFSSSTPSVKLDPDPAPVPSVSWRKPLVNRFVLPPPSYVPADTSQVSTPLPPGFTYNEKFLSSDGHEKVIQCDVCGGKLFASVFEAWNHSLVDPKHLHALHRRIESLFKSRRTFPKNEVFCEPCGTVILDRTHFTSQPHIEFVNIMHKLDLDYFQPFVGPVGDILFFSWRTAQILGRDTVPPSCVIFNNPQLLVHQWIVVKDSLPPSNGWCVSQCDFEVIKEVLDDIPLNQRGMEWTSPPFMNLALDVRSRSKINRDLYLSPNDLIQLSRNRVVLDSSDKDLTILRCTICEYTSTYLGGIIHHVKRPAHRFAILRAVPKESNELCPLMLGQLLRLWATAKTSRDLACELCDLRGIANESLLRLHMHSDKHLDRCSQFKEKFGTDFWQCYVNPDTQKLYIVSLTGSNKVYDVFSLVSELGLAQMHGHDRVDSICILSPVFFA